MEPYVEVYKDEVHVLEDMSELGKQASQHLHAAPFAQALTRRARRLIESRQ